MGSAEERRISFPNNPREEPSDSIKQFFLPGYSPSDELDLKVMSFKELIPLLSTDDYYCTVRIKVEGSGWLEDEPVLGRFACAALHKFNQESGTHYKFGRIYYSSASIGTGDPWFLVKFVATEPAGCSTEMFKAFVSWNFELDVEEVQTVKYLYKYEIEDSATGRLKEEPIASHYQLLNLSEEDILEEKRLCQLLQVAARLIPSKYGDHDHSMMILV